MSRPLSITIIGVIGVIWGLGGTVAGLGGLLIILTTPDWFMNLLRREAEPELVRVFTQALGDPGVRRWSFLLTAMQTGLNALLLFGSVALLRLQPKGWWLMMGYATGALLWAVVDRVILNPTVYQSFRERYQIDDPTARPVPRFTLGLLYPVITAYILTRPKIMALYKQEEEE
jgi:hypothetical protein